MGKDWRGKQLGVLPRQEVKCRASMSEARHTVFGVGLATCTATHEAHSLAKPEFTAAISALQAPPTRPTLASGPAVHQAGPGGRARG